MSFGQLDQNNNELRKREEHSFFAKEVSCFRAKYLTFTSLYTALLALAESWMAKGLLSEPANLKENIGGIIYFAIRYAASVGLFTTIK
jgi:hypothetical protein